MGLWSWLSERGLLPEQQGRRTAPESGSHYPAQPDSAFDYRLEHWDAGKEGGRGYLVVRNADGQTLSWHTLPRSHGLESISVVGEKYEGRLDALQSAAFSPGRALRLVREPDNPYDANAVAVYDAAGSLHVGYLPKEHAARIATQLDAGQSYQCYSMWEGIKDGRRIQLRLLLLDENASVVVPQ